MKRAQTLFHTSALVAAASSLLLYVPGQLRAQNSSGLIAQYTFTRDCGTARSIVSTSGWTCPTVTRTNDAGSATFTNDRAGQVSDAAVTLDMTTRLVRNDGPRGVFGSEDWVTVSVYSKAPRTSYNLTFQFDTDVSVVQNGKFESTGAHRAEAWMEGVSGWSTAVSFQGAKSESKSSTTRWTSADTATSLNGTPAYLLGSLLMKVRVESDKASSVAVATGKLRILNTSALLSSWTPQGGFGIGDGGNVSVQCSANKSAVGSVITRSGNAIAGRYDPVATRGYPLATNIFVSNQTRFPALKSPVGIGGSFTYGIAVRTGSDENKYVVDENGTEISFGKPVPVLFPWFPWNIVVSYRPEAGVYSRLTAYGSLWSLDNAGPPGRLHQAGNYHYLFLSNGSLLAISDPSNNVQYISYNADGLPTQVADVGTKKTISFQYDSTSPGLIARVVENGGAAISHLSYQNNRLTGIVLRDAAGTKINEVAYGYESGRLASLTADNDPASRIVWTYTDIGAQVSRANMSWGSGSTAGATNLDYLAGGGAGSTRVVRRNAYGGMTVSEFDAAGNLVRVESPRPEGAATAPVTTIAYDANRNPITISDGLINRKLTYNEFGKVTRVVDGAGGEWSFTYQGVDLLTITDSIGLVEARAYGDLKNPHSPTAIRDGAGNTWSLSYNAYGQVLTLTPPQGSPTGPIVFTYDENDGSTTYGYLKKVANAAGDATLLDSYSPLGDATSLTTSPGDGVLNTIRLAYDAAQRITKTTFPDGASATREYAGRFLSKAIDPAGNATSFEYCPSCGAIEAVKSPLGKTVRVTHDGDHQVSEFIDARTKTTRYSYGLAGEVREVRYPDGSGETYRYDETGRLAVIRNARSQERSFTYDQAGRVRSISFSNGQPGIEYAYFPDGRLRSVKDEAGTTTYSYTKNRLLETETKDFSISGLNAKQALSYAYNPDSTMKSMVWTNAGATAFQWSYDYDSAGRITKVSNGPGDSSTFIYDHEGKITSQKNSNGTELTTTYNEARGWPTNIQWKAGSSTIASYALSYDLGSNTVGNLTRAIDASGAQTNWSYDALYRLTAEARPGTSTTFGYDLAGNITLRNGTAFASYDDANKIQTLAGGTVSYDGDGNLTASSLVAGGAQITWDARNKLRSIGSISYRYDGGGSRVTRTEGGTTTVYIFSGSTLIGEISNGVPKAAYTWGPDGLLSERLLDSNRSYFYHFGPQGETRQLTDSTATVASAYSYDAYGAEITSTGQGQNPFHYGGKVGYFTDGGNMLAGARWYSPRLMRWLSRDPIGYLGGDNQYSYVADNPIGATDPTGELDVYIWHPVAPYISRLGGSVGHASIMLDDGTYISHWPNSSESILGDLHAPPIKDRDFISDIYEEGPRLPSRIIHIDGLNEAAIARWWNSVKQSGVYDLQVRNCATTVAEALAVGFGRPLRFSLIPWSPGSTEELADALAQLKRRGTR